MAVTGFHGIPDGKGKATPWFISVAWASQGTALVMSVLVFLLYWILDYSAARRRANPKPSAPKSRAPTTTPDHLICAQAQCAVPLRAAL